MRRSDRAAGPDPRHPRLPYWDGPRWQPCCGDAEWPFFGNCPRHPQPVRLDPPTYPGPPPEIG